METAAPYWQGSQPTSPPEPLAPLLELCCSPKGADLILFKHTHHYYHPPNNTKQPLINTLPCQFIIGMEEESYSHLRDRGEDWVEVWCVLDRLSQLCVKGMINHPEWNEWSTSFKCRPLFIMEINILLRFKVLLLPLTVLARLQQLLVRTIAVQHYQLDVIAGLFLRGGQEFLEELLTHEDLKGNFTLGLDLLVRLDQVVEHFSAFLDHEGDGPSEEVHEVRQQIGVRTFHELLNVERIVLSGWRRTSNLMTAALLL